MPNSRYLKDATNLRGATREPADDVLYRFCQITTLQLQADEKVQKFFTPVDNNTYSFNHISPNMHHDINYTESSPNANDSLLKPQSSIDS